MAEWPLLSPLVMIEDLSGDLRDVAEILGLPTALYLARRVHSVNIVIPRAGAPRNRHLRIVAERCGDAIADALHGAFPSQPLILHSFETARKRAAIRFAALNPMHHSPLELAVITGLSEVEVYDIRSGRRARPAESQPSLFPA